MKYVIYQGVKIPIDPPLRGDRGVRDGAIAGAWKAGENSKMVYEAVLPNFDWRQDWFNPERQYFDSGDSWACTNFSDINSAKIQLKRSTGEEYDFSEAASALLSGTRPTVGNYMDAPCETARKEGRILQKDWPNGDNVDQFYRPLTNAVKKKALRFYEAHEYIGTDYASIRYHGKQAPINILIRPGNINHDVCALYIDNNGIWCADSYEHGTNDNFLFITTQIPLAALKNVVKPMNTVYFVHIKGTQEYGLLSVSPVGKQYVPASTEADLIARGGPAVPLTNGKPNYNMAIEITLP